MTDRVKQADGAKVGNTGKSNYDLFGGYDVARQEAMDKFKGTEKKTPAEEFAGKFWSKLIGSKLVKAIDAYAEEKGIGWADKQTLVSEYINTIRKPVLTGTDVKAAYKEDLKWNALVNFWDPLRAGYKELEPFGIKVADKQKEEVADKKWEKRKPVSWIPEKKEEDKKNMNWLPVAKTDSWEVMPNIWKILSIWQIWDIGQWKLKKQEFSLENIWKIAPDDEWLISLANTILDRAKKEKYNKQRKPGAGDVATIK